MKCLKEAYIKALGIGIHSRLASLDFRLGTGEAPKLIEEGRPNGDYRFLERSLAGEHLCAIALTVKTSAKRCPLTGPTAGGRKGGLHLRLDSLEAGGGGDVGAAGEGGAAARCGRRRPLE